MTQHTEIVCITNTMYTTPKTREKTFNFSYKHSYPQYPPKRLWITVDKKNDKKQVKNLVN